MGIGRQVIHTYDHIRAIIWVADEVPDTGLPPADTYDTPICRSGVGEAGGRVSMGYHIWTLYGNDSII